MERTALLIRCTVEEAEKIRQAAKAERRTLSGYILNSVMARIEMRERMLSGTPAQQEQLRRRAG